MSQGPFPPEYPDLPPPEGPGPDVRDRVQLPATFLIITGTLNLLLALFALWMGVVARSVSPEQLEADYQRHYPEQYQKMKEAGVSTQDLLQGMIYSFSTIGIAGLIASPLIIAGGVCMLRLRLFGLAVTAGIIAFIPCISGLGCCLIGQGVGIWALVVLFSDEVRQAFS